MITVSLNTKEFERDMMRFARKNEKGFILAVTDSTNKTQKMAKMKVRNLTRGSKVKSGTLINNINQKITSKGMTGEVISGASYSQAFEDGQRPHTIRVRNKRVLAGPARGAPAGMPVTKAGYAIYGRQVQHPGTHPRPFMYPAWRFGCSNLEKKIKEALR